MKEGKKVMAPRTPASPVVCLYCPVKMERGSGEHVILSALGGRKQTRTACCQKCNARLGDSIDKPLADALQFLCNQVGITTGRGKPGPTIRNIPQAGRDYSIDLLPGGTPRISRVEVTAKPVAGMGAHVSMRARDEAEVDRLVEGQLKRFGASAASIVEMTAKRVTHHASEIPVNLALGGDIQLRSVAKMMLNYVCTRVRPDRLRSGSFSRLIEYINKGTRLTPGWVNHDYVNVFPQTTQLTDVDHRVAIFGSGSEKVVIGLLELFGELRFSSILSDTWEGSDFGYAYVVDPRSGTGRDERTLRPTTLTKENVLARTFDNSVGVAAFVRVVERAAERQRQEVRRSIIAECMREHWHGPLTESALKDVAKCVAERYLEFLSRIDTECTFKVTPPRSSGSS